MRNRWTKRNETDTKVSKNHIDETSSNMILKMLILSVRNSQMQLKESMSMSILHLSHFDAICF